MTQDASRLNIDTLLVHSGLDFPIGRAQPAAPPIVPSVGYVHPTMDETDAALGYSGGTPADPDRYVYLRHGGPNQAALEEAVAALEGAEGAVSFSSGMAALHAALLALVPPGGAVVAAEQTYGVTRSLLDWMASVMGLSVHYADFLDVEAARGAIREVRPACVVCEVLTNPLARVVAVDAIAEAARAAGARLLVDNTFATPFLLRPLALGADVVVHSSTKFLNGHGDVLGGVVVGPADLMQAVYQHRRLLGAMPSAFDAWLTLRGMRTLALRMRQACANAQRIAEWLSGQRRIARVCYPGLPTDESHARARALFRAGYFGSMIAFEVADLDRAGAFAFVERLRLIRPVTSLGDVFSLILHPASSSHRALTPQQREALGIREGTLRLSVGIEDAADLIADLEQALQAV